MKKTNVDKVAEYSVASSARKKKHLTFAQKIIAWLSVAAAFVVTAVVVLSLYFTGVLYGAVPVSKRNKSTEKETVLPKFVDYAFNQNKKPAGKYADVTFLCEDKEYKVNFYLFSSYAPNTVSNFVSYAQKGFYNGTAVRSGELEEKNGVTKGRMICGGYLRNASGEIATKVPDSGAEPIKGEFYDNDYTANLLSNTAGVMGMIHTQNNDDATTDFYILAYDDVSLNGKYAAFGKTTTQEGLKFIQMLNKKASENTPVSIKSITISTYSV